MITLRVVKLHASDFSSGETRLGDAQIIYDGQNYDVIDGNCGAGAARLITALKSLGAKKPYLHISHPHWDHRDGIRKIINDSYFSPRALYCQNPDSITAHNSDIKSDINALRTVINEAKAKNIPVIYLNNGDYIVHGDIKFKVYRDFPRYTGNSDAYLNDGSLCYWFPELLYLTTGDAGMWCANRYNLHPVFVKCGHHGNDMSGDGLKPSQMCPWLYKYGCHYYWDNDFSTRLTDFLMTGREDAINAGMTIFSIHDDIVATFADGKATISYAGKSYTYSAPYNGKGEKKTGEWLKGSKGIWYRYPDGTWATGWALIDNKWYLFDADGWLLHGWQLAKWSGGKSWFFFNYKTGEMLTGWQELPWGSGKSDYFLLDPKTGAMLTGWQWSTKDCKTGWYFLDKSTGAMKTGWVYDNGSWFYLDADGKMLTGWVTYKGRKCYLEPKSDKTHVQGVCYVNRTAVIDGKTYKFDKDGYAEELTSTGNITKVSGKLNEISASRRQFVIDIANYVRKYASQYGIKVYSPIIAQAIHESGWGESKLSAKYHNYFGLKCGTAWKGKSVNMKTQEEYSAGNLTTISANFRAYDSMEEGVKGYFEFIQLPRYSNLKGITSPRKYLETIKADGYATGNSYVDHVMNLINLYNLTQFDGVVAPTTPSTPSKTTTKANPVDVLLSIASAEVGYHEGANNKNKYGDELHKIQPRNMDINAAWCDAFADWTVLKMCEAFGYGADMAREVLCGDFDDYTYASINLYKKQGRWSSSPARGYQIFFGGSGHTGWVESVDSKIHTIEGNKSDQVMRCSYKIGDSRILGYGRPKYELLSGGLTAENMPLIKKGATGFAVVELQKRLNAASYNGKIVLTVDGDFGDNTYNALKAYQKDRGLEVDGECGKNSWQSLFNEV